MGFGLALSGGGAKGAAHVGVLKALCEAGYYPEAVAGTSAGSIAAGLYASGMAVSEMEKTVRLFSKKGREYLDPDYSGLMEFLPQILAGKPAALGGLFKGEKLLKCFVELTAGKRLDEAICLFAIPAVDLNSGDTVVYTNAEKAEFLEHVRWQWEGCLGQAMMASSSVPAVFCPVKTGAFRLVDGGVTDNLPVNILRALGIRQILAVDLGSSYEKPEDDSLMEVVSHSFAIMSSRLKECGSDEGHILLSPPTRSCRGLFDFDGMEKCMEEAYYYMKKWLELRKHGLRIVH